MHLLRVVVQYQGTAAFSMLKAGTESVSDLQILPQTTNAHRALTNQDDHWDGEAKAAPCQGLAMSIPTMPPLPSFDTDPAADRRDPQDISLCREMLR